MVWGHKLPHVKQQVAGSRLQTRHGSPAAIYLTPLPWPAAMQAYPTIVRQEGLKALWTGTTPNIARNSVVNAAELATYDQVQCLEV